MSFTHLHVHTEYSLLDGVNKIPKLFDRVKELGMGSVAMTDHGVMNGVAEFWKLSKDFGVKPLIGCEIYVSPKERTLRAEVEGVKYYHLLLIAKNQVGYRNLAKIVSIGQLEGMYYKPRVDRETLAKYSEGIICTSACMAGPLSRHILRGEFDKAEDWLNFLKQTFKDDFFLELQRHGYDENDNYDKDKYSANNSAERDGASEETIDDANQQKFSNTKLREFADKYKLPLVATADAHYLKKEDKEIQTVLFAIKDGKLLNDDSCRKGYEGTYILSPEEMQKKFSDIPEAIDNTQKIAESVESFSVGYDRVQPRFWNVPSGKTARDELLIQTYIGAIKKYLPLEDQSEKEKEISTAIKKSEKENNVNALKEFLTKELIERLDYELDVIHDKGYDDYFLVVSDLMKWSATQGILMGVRGSVAGSAVAHCLDIVEVDPIKWELYFERFLNPERPSPPDIDMDIQDDRRDEVINYVKEKYGEDSVVAISAIGRLKTKAAIRDVARVMGIDLKTADQLSKMVKVVFGKVFQIDKMIAEDKEFASIIESDPNLQKLAGYVRKIENISRHMSVHACGHLITPGPVVDYIPLSRETGGERVVTQLEGPWIEELGLMKFDFLGLRTLTIIKNAINYIKERKDVDIDFYTIPSSDKETFELFSRGETIGVFQFESPPMQQYLKDLKPETQEDICFMVAAYRPGAMKYIPDYIKVKHGQKDINYLINDLEPILSVTNGYMIYQEQLMRVSVDLAGYSMGQADSLRKAVGKKKMDVMEKEEPVFKEGIMKRGFNKEVADEVWKMLLPFADYGFNKAHAAGYAVLAYKCAYLKAHYPIEFITALIHSDLENLDRVTVDIKEAKRMGFKVLPPSINDSDVYFSPRNEDTIRFGLGAIKNVGVKVCEEIVKERNLNGPFQSITDFTMRLGTKNANKRVLEALIKSGAMDEFGNRNALVQIIPEAIEHAASSEKSKTLGQTDLFGAFDIGNSNVNININIINLPKVDPVTESQLIEWEKEYMGIYISTHPLENYRWITLINGFKNITDIENLHSGDTVKFMGVISGIKLTTTKAAGEKMAILTIEDMSGKHEAVLFPKKYAEILPKNVLVETKPLIFAGQINERNERRSIIINDIGFAETMDKPSALTLDIRGIEDKDKLAVLKQCFTDDGDIQVNIMYGSDSETKNIVRKTFLTDANLEILSPFIARTW